MTDTSTHQQLRGLGFTSTPTSRAVFHFNRRAAMSSGSGALTLQPSDLALTTAIVSDALDKVGCRDHVLRSAITPLVPGTRLLGRAATVHFAPSAVDSAAPYDEAIAFIDTLGVGDVAVVATDANGSAAY